MNEATPTTRWTMPDGTVLKLVPVGELASDQPRWFALPHYKGDPYASACLRASVRDALHLHPATDYTTSTHAWVEALPPPKAPVDELAVRRTAKAAAKKATLKATVTTPILTTDKKARKEMPIARGVVDYFPRALAAVANVSFVANEQHNPGQPMHWSKGKSDDHADCIMRHLIERGATDDDGLLHSAKLAWRALALLETELERGGDEPVSAVKAA